MKCRDQKGGCAHCSALDKCVCATERKREWGHILRYFNLHLETARHHVTHQQGCSVGQISLVNMRCQLSDQFDRVSFNIKISGLY